MRFKHRTGAIKRLGDYLLERDVAPAPLLRRLGLPPSVLLEEQGWIDRGVSQRIVEEAVRATGDLLLGIHVGEATRLDDYGPWGLGIANSHTLRDALILAAREMHTVSTGTSLHLREEGGTATVVLNFMPPIESSPRQHIESNLRALRIILNLATEVVPATVRLPHEAMPRVDLEPWLGSDLQFRTELAELVFDRSALQLPLRPPQPWQEQPVPASTARDALMALETIMPFERPTVQGVAASMGISVRKMQRHLSVWGITFGELLDQHRQRMAQQYLGSRRLSITDIAFRLGYSDSAHFTRAFRRWTGNSPRQALKDLSAGVRLERPDGGHVAAPAQKLYLPPAYLPRDSPSLS